MQNEKGQETTVDKKRWERCPAQISNRVYVVINEDSCRILLHASKTSRNVVR